MLVFDRAILKRDTIELAIAFDRASARSFDKDGRMHVLKCRISKANVCPYYGREIHNYQSLGLAADRVYMMYRDPQELAKAAPTFHNLQLLARHVKVDATDSKKHITIGTVGTAISFDGEYLVADQLTVWDKLGIDMIETDEAKELSSSYYFRADMTSGITPAGVAFDGVMRDIKGNHVALVREGRAGSDVVITDEFPSELSNMALKRPNLLASLVALGCVAVLTDEASRVAFDEKLCAMTAKDSDMDMSEDVEDDPENPGKKRKKKLNPGAGSPTNAGGALASDEHISVAVDAKLKAGGYTTKAEVDALVADAATKARAAATNDANALHVARTAVKPLVGVVTFDSAEAVYKYALDKEGVALDGVPPAAYAALVTERVKLKTASGVPAGTLSIAAASEASSALAKSLPGISRFNRA